MTEPLCGLDEDALDIADYLKEEGAAPAAHGHRTGFAALFIGAVGVVYGDIGTSPIYAFREALKPVAADGVSAPEMLGLLSILLWTLFLIVTVNTCWCCCAQTTGARGASCRYIPWCVWP